MAENIENYEKLVSAGDDALRLGNREEAANYYESAYKIKKSGRVAFSIFVWYVSQADYVNASKWLLELGSFNDYKNDFYTYALLLNNYVQLPDDLIKELSNLREDDLRVTVNDYRFVNHSWHNKMRNAIFCENYREAYSYAERIIKQGKCEPQEYAIYRLLGEKVVKEPKKVKVMIEEERFAEVDDYLNNLTDYEKNDDLAKQLVQDAYDLLDGIAIEQSKREASSLADAIYFADYHKALELCGKNVILKALLNKVIELKQRDIVNKYEGNLGYYFYDICEQIYNALNDKAYDVVKEKINEYLDVTGKVDYKNYLIGMVDVYKMIPEWQGDLINLLSDITYGDKPIDGAYLKRIFGSAVSRHKYDIAASLLNVFKYIEVPSDMNVDYMEFVYNRELYLNRKVPYATQEEDDLLTAKLNELVEKLSEDSLIRTIKANNKHEEYVIKYVLKNTYSSYYKVETEDYPAVIYIKKQKHTQHFRKDIAVTKINECIECGDYKSALETIKKNLDLSTKFDHVLLSFAAYVYDLMGDNERLEYINSILLNVFNIEDYKSIINSDEVIVLDSNNTYVDIVKKLINKPVE